MKKELQESAPSAIPQQVIRGLAAEVTTTHYSGPIPPPGLLRQYDEIMPSGADRIMRMAEQQAAHRIDLEHTVIHGDPRRSWWGLILGFAATLVISAVGLTVALCGSPAAGATIITGTIVALAAVFVSGQRSRRAERERKAMLMVGRSKP